VPAQAHLEALRRAIAPWVRIKDDEKDRVAEVRKTLTVLKNASVSSIAERCLAEDYTHVHILAHGAPVPHTEDRRFGVMLRADDGSGDHVVVDGQSLAMALKSMSANGTAKRPPTVVSLAICDSGNAGTVLTPGGSIAHELHAQDIPWVIASQFPLWMRASNLAVEILYGGLLEGRDPRWVLHELRRRLRMEVPDTHDWASIVAYAAVAPDLEAQVDAFRSRQVKAKMEVLFDRMDELVGADESEPEKRNQHDPATVKRELKKLSQEIRADMSRWREEKAASLSPKEKAERLGMSAASEKRIAIVYEQFKDKDDEKAQNKINRDEAYRQSRRFYQEALKVEPSNHWVLTQMLSITATPTLASDEEATKKLAGAHAGWWQVARDLAEWRLPSLTSLDRVWAHGTLAELELLGAIYGGPGFDADKARRSIEDHCRQLRELSSADTFPVMSTRRQFQRYLDPWGRSTWKELAEAAVRVLSDKAEVIHHNGEEFRSERLQVPVPSVIRLRYFVRVPYQRRAPLSRRAVFLRDGGRCQYCGKRAESIDHVVPRSRGGRHEWGNVVSACRRCNHVKADRTVAEIGWRLHPPQEPSGSAWRVLGTGRSDPSWAPYLSAYGGDSVAGVVSA